MTSRYALPPVLLLGAVLACSSSSAPVGPSDAATDSAADGGTGSTSSSSGSSSGSGSGSSSGSPGDSGVDSGGSSGAGEAGSSTFCIDWPANTAPTVTDTCTSATMPASGTATGGAIPSGTYVLTSSTIYQQSSSCNATTHNAELVFDAAAGTFVLVQTYGGTVEAPAGFTYTTSGFVLTYTLVCSPGSSGSGTDSWEYTVSGNTLTTYDYAHTALAVFTKK